MFLTEELNNLYPGLHFLEGFASMNPGADGSPLARSAWERKPARNASAFVWAVVREPIETALSAYLQAIDVRRAHSAGSRNATAWLAALSCSQNCRRPSCVHPNERFHAFLDAVEAGQALGSQFFHAYPQALKLDVVKPAIGDGRRFDALIRLEQVDAGLWAVARLAGATHMPKARKPSQAHTTDGDPCAAVDLELDARLARRLCKLYDADFTCFGYARPAACGIGR